MPVKIRRTVKAKPSTNGHTEKPIQKEYPESPEIKKLRGLQRERAMVIRSRIMIANRLRSIIAGTLGYTSAMKNKDEGKRKFKEADALIKQVTEGTMEHPLASFIRVTQMSVQPFDELQAKLEKAMLGVVKTLPKPILAWIEHPDQRGFGPMSLAMVIGELGNPSNYPNKGCIWKRMGCQPILHNGICAMPSTWKMKAREYGSLPSDAWVQAGYNPRRRAIMFVIGENLLKNNQSIYKERYLEAKTQAYRDHPDWTAKDDKSAWRDCNKCEGRGKGCKTCGGSGKTCQRAHRHGMLLAVKLLLKNLWLEWKHMGS